MILSIDLSTCSGCGLCVRVCPTDVLRMTQPAGQAFTASSVPAVVYPESCFTCYNCEVFCPQNCVRVSPFRKPIQPILGGR